MLNAIEPGSVVATYELAAGGPACALNPGTVILEMKDGPYEPVKECDVLR